MTIYRGGGSNGRGWLNGCGEEQKKVNSFKQIFFLSMFILIKLITGDHDAGAVWVSCRNGILFTVLRSIDAPKPNPDNGCLILIICSHPQNPLKNRKSIRISFYWTGQFSDENKLRRRAVEFKLGPTF